MVCSWILLLDDEPGDKFQVGFLLNLLLFVGQDETATGEETSGGTLAKGGSERFHGFVQEPIVILHVAAVVRLLVEEIAKCGVALGLVRAEDAVGVENLLGVSEGEADVAIVEDVNEEMGMERVSLME